MNTNSRMGVFQGQGNKVPAACCATLFCCFWVPLVFFMCAANILPTCEEPNLGRFLKLYSVVPLLTGHVLHCVFAVCAYLELKSFFRRANHVIGFTGCLLLCFQAYGWFEYFRTSDVNCYD